MSSSVKLRRSYSFVKSSEVKINRSKNLFVGRHVGINSHLVRQYGIDFVGFSGVDHRRVNGAATDLVGVARRVASCCDRFVLVAFVVGFGGPNNAG